MPFNGSGTFNLTDGSLSGRDIHDRRSASGATLDAAGLDAIINDIAESFEECLTKNGETGPMTAALNMGSHKITSVAAGTEATDVMNVLQATEGGYNFGVATFSSNAYSITLSPTISSYKNGLRVKVWVANTNTATNPTLNINAKGAITIKDQTGVALPAGGIIANSLLDLVYYGSTFYLLNVAGILDWIPTLTPLGGGSLTTANAEKARLTTIGGIQTWVIRLVMRASGTVTSVEVSLPATLPRANGGYGISTSITGSGPVEFAWFSKSGDLTKIVVTGFNGSGGALNSSVDMVHNIFIGM